jgi:hypothetical protein
VTARDAVAAKGMEYDDSTAIGDRTVPDRSAEKQGRVLFPVCNATENASIKMKAT